MNRNLFQYVGLRHLKMKPTRTILTTIGVSLGIALYVGIAIINRSTLHSFKESIEAVAGKATLIVSAGEAGFPEYRLDLIKKVPGVKYAVPMVESRAYFAGNKDSSETITILGVDLLQEQAVRTYKTTDEQVIDDPLVFLNQPDSIIITRAFAAQHHFKIDSTFALATAHGTKRFTVRGMLSPEGPAKAYGGAIAIMDIDGARMTFGKEGKIDRVDVVTVAGEDIDQVAQRINHAVGSGYRAERPETQNENMERMVKTYQVMLTFFSTLALLVGLFLVTNSVSIAVAERKREIGTLRALGATRGGILTLFLSEAVVMGAMGAFVGAWLGRGLAAVLLSLVTRSMSSQYLTRIDVSTLLFGPGEVLRAVALGATAAFLAALFPAWRATTIDPLEAMRHHEVGENANQQGFFRYSPWIGVGLLSFMGLATWAGLPVRFQWIDTLCQICAILGSALLGPTLVVFLIRLMRPLVLRMGGTISRLAQDNLLRNPRRTGSNVMSLMVGLMLTIMIAIVNVSFRMTITDWFNRILRADLFVSSTGRLISYQTQPQHEDLGPELEKIPGIKMTNGKGAYGIRFIHVTYEGRQLGMKAWDEPDPAANYSILDVQDRTPFQAGRDLYHSPDPTVLVSENFVLHFKKKTGDSLDLDTPSGRSSFRIVGVVVDFAGPEGILYIDRQLYRRIWHDPLVSAFGLNLAPGADLSTVRQEIDRQFGRARNISVTSNAELRDQMVSVIDQSFAYTRAIEGAALLVGLLGLLNTLLISVMERMRELGMLRAVGMSRSQVSKMILQEALVQGALGAVAAVVLGSGIAYLWIKYSLAHVLGWMIHFYFPWLAVGGTVLVGTAVALFAGFFPARRASLLEICEALEYE
ncbi:FtsX-like permease family protein [Bdellovibrionota bacterium FG-1]